ncbi:YncE family protein [Rhizobium leucaenae]|uniref:YVTN family beta-propeller protein n=1 Tax=Rhizobium leucaenae TaxID=29450 RepID=A0A7W6ZZE6_9HYPH|nr:YncE family protein [Rhizobium leucaenae]MBB4571628.1 YVTN family beta-propeller protein [Rhizobium leucaenae]MBB6304774.1 YVTN family beta-propeller protein [Rhizobium leucaenae]
MTRGHNRFKAISAFVLCIVALQAASASADPCAEACSEQATPQGTVNIYRDITSDHMSPATTGALPRVYVPNHGSDSVSVIDSGTLKEVDRFQVGRHPQHIVPSWDMKTLWVANDAGLTSKGSLTPIDPKTGKPGKTIPVDDPYNMYFMPDGSSAIIVNEAYRRLELRDPQTMAIQSLIPTPTCHGINHADFAADNSYAIFTCEFAGGGLVKVDLSARKVVGNLTLSKKGMPQDIRLSPDGKVFYVADMMNDGVFLIDGSSLSEIGFIPTGLGSHGLTVSRDGTQLFVANRGSHNMKRAGPHGPGSVTVIDFATRSVVAQWPVPGGGSPDMGNVSADGKQLWLSGRFDSEVYMFDTTSGAVRKVRVGVEPHGLTVWPQPGRYSQGHTGNMR